MIKENDIYVKFFRHFSERLSLRYNVLITFQQYIELCTLKIDVEEVQHKDNGKRVLIGYVRVNNEKVKVVKEIGIKGSPLTTALPIKHLFPKNKVL